VSSRPARDRIARAGPLPEDGLMCTSLIYTDANGNPYYGRTLELDVDLTYVIAYVPAGQQFRSAVEGHDPVAYTVKHPFLGVTSPARVPTPEAPIGAADLKVIEGLNTEGVTCSLLAYPTTAPNDSTSEITNSLLQATDIGSWILGSHASVDEVKAALEAQPVFLTRLPVAGDLPFPFHIAVHDRSGKSIVIEWHHGEQSVYDNPVGVMTNGPDFQWHLTNLNNWTHLTNVDASAGQFGSLEVHQPDSGIATAALPASNTSVGRFIRAVFYSQFTEKVSDPDAALLTLSHVMNNFDRPRGATVSPHVGGEGMSFHGTSRGDAGAPPTEYTSWTSLADLANSRFLLRTYDAIGYSRFDLGALAGSDKGLQIVLSSKLDPLGGDLTGAMTAVPVK
jgi:choloylglycine hydrolase